MGVLLAQNITRKIDQLIVYAFRFFNSAEHNYSTTKIEALTMVELHYISLGIICWEINLCFVLIIWF
jgi:hypothetical protein